MEKRKNPSQANSIAQGSDNIKVLENILMAYKDMDKKRITYKESIKKMRTDAIKLREEKEKLQLELSISTAPDGKNAPFTDIDLLAKKIDSNNSLVKEKTCNLAFQHIETIKSNISIDSKKAYDSIEPLEKSVKLLKKQVKYTRHLEETLELFSKKKILDQKLEESNEIIAMLAEHIN